MKTPKDLPTNSDTDNRVVQANPGKCFRDKNDLPLPPLETPVELRDPIKVDLWETYKQYCLFYESYEDFIWRMRSEHGFDWFFKKEQGLILQP